MSIRRLKNGNWQIRYYASGTKDSSYRQETLPRSLTRAEADRIYKSRLSAAAARNGEACDELLTISGLFEHYLEIQGRNMAPASADRARQVYKKHFKEAIGHMRVSSLRPLHVEEIRGKRLAEGATPSTVNREWAILKAVLNWGEAKGLIERNPIRRKAVEKLKADDGRTIYFEPEEWRRFVAAFDDAEAWRAHVAKVRRFGPAHERRERKFGPGFGAGRDPEGTAAAEYLERLRECVPVFRLLLHTGCRLNEVLDLRWRDVDFRAGHITAAQRKTRKTKIIPMSDELRSELERLPRGVGDARVLVRRSGRPFYSVEVQRAFHVAKKLSGIRDELTPHTIRHTFASWLVMAGTNLRTVQELLGHSNIATTTRYAHLSPGHLAEAAAVIGKTLTGTGFKEADRDR